MDYDKKQVELIGVEAGGPQNSKKHAAPLTYGSKIGILHGAMHSMLTKTLKDKLKKQSQYLQD